MEGGQRKVVSIIDSSPYALNRKAFPGVGWTAAILSRPNQLVRKVNICRNGPDISPDPDFVPSPNGGWLSVLWLCNDRHKLNGH